MKLVLTLAMLTLQLADPVPTVDQLVERFAAAQKETATAKTKEAAALKDLRAALQALNEKLRDLGVNPGPTPPAPTPPGPIPPTDPFAASLKAAYATDGPADAAKKQEQLLDLIEVYRQAQTFAKATSLTSVSQVIAKARDTATVLGIAADDLKGVRTAIAAELRKEFPADATLDTAARDKLTAVFARVHAALSAVHQ